MELDGNRLRIFLVTPLPFSRRGAGGEVKFLPLHPFTMALFGLFKSSNANGEMSFWSHIDALRGHLFRSVVVVLVLTGVLMYFSDFLYDRIIFGPLHDEFLTYRFFCKLSHKFGMGEGLCFGHYTFKLQSLGLSDQFTSLMWVSFLGALIVGSPYVLWEVWRFIKPALKEREVKASSGFIISSSFLFIFGVLFSYFIIVPITINFLGNFKVSQVIENNFTMDSYISTVTTLSIAAGLVFELPVLVYFLSLFGLMSPQFMRKYRKHAFVVILIVAAVITPSPDITSQLLVGIPLYFLYEASIFVSYYAIKKKLASGNN